MYAQRRFVTSVRGIGLSPTTGASAGPIVTGRMNAAFGLRADFFAFFMTFFAGFFAAFFFAISTPWKTHNASRPSVAQMRSVSEEKTHFFPLSEPPTPLSGVWEP